MDVGTGWEAMLEFGLQGVAYQEVFGPAEAAAPEALRALQEKVEVHRRQETSTQRIGVSPHAPYTVSKRLYRERTRLRPSRRTAHDSAYRRIPRRNFVCTAMALDHSPNLIARGVSTSWREAARLSSIWAAWDCLVPTCSWFTPLKRPLAISTASGKRNARGPLPEVQRISWTSCGAGGGNARAANSRVARHRQRGEQRGVRHVCGDAHGFRTAAPRTLTTSFAWPRSTAHEH